MTSELVRQLLEAGVHFGHQTKRWNPKMKPFIFGRRSGIYIIDLEKTEQHLKTAGEFLEQVVAGGRQVLFVGTKKQARALVVETANRCEMPHVTTRWLGGTLTNFETIKRNLQLLRELRAKKADGFFTQISKKEGKRLQRHLDRLETHFNGLAEMHELPACLFVVDTKREEITIREANRLRIPVVAICDTNADPDRIEYPIPGNDDAIRSVKLILEVVAERVLAGRRRLLVTQEPPEPSTPKADGADGSAGEPAAAPEVPSVTTDTPQTTHEG